MAIEKGSTFNLPKGNSILTVISYLRDEDVYYVRFETLDVFNITEDTWLGGTRYMSKEGIEKMVNLYGED